MVRKRERGNGDGDVWSRKNKEGKIIGYRASYWADTPSGPKRRYVTVGEDSLAAIGRCARRVENHRISPDVPAFRGLCVQA